MVLGIGASTRLSSARWPRFVTQGLHRNISLFVLVLLALHVVAAVLDDYVTITVQESAHPVHRYVPAGVDGARDAVVRPDHRDDRDQPAAAADRVRDLARGALDVVRVLAAGRGARAGHGLGHPQGLVGLVHRRLRRAGAAGLAWRIVAGWPRRALLRTSAVLVTACAVALVFTWAKQGPFAPGWSKRSGTTQSSGQEVDAARPPRTGAPGRTRRRPASGSARTCPGSGRRPGRRPARSPASGRPGCGSGGPRCRRRSSNRRATGAAGVPRLLAAVRPDGRPVSLAEHRAGYGPLRTAGAGRLIAESGLRGRGGAGFPVEAKVQAVRAVRGKPSWSSTARPATRWGRRTRSSISRVPHLILDGAQVAADAVEARQIMVSVVQRPGVFEVMERALAERHRARLDEVPMKLVAAPGPVRHRRVVGDRAAPVRQRGAAGVPPAAHGRARREGPPDAGPERRDAGEPGACWPGTARAGSGRSGWRPSPGRWC